MDARGHWSIPGLLWNVNFSYFLSPSTWLSRAFAADNKKRIRYPFRPPHYFFLQPSPSPPLLSKEHDCKHSSGAHVVAISLYASISESVDVRVWVSTSLFVYSHVCVSLCRCVGVHIFYMFVCIFCEFMNAYAWVCIYLHVRTRVYIYFFPNLGEWVPYLFETKSWEPLGTERIVIGWSVCMDMNHYSQ